MSRLDPKPGRWILPLAVIGIIGFTAVFVNALPPNEEAADNDIATATTETPSSGGTTSTVVVAPDSTTTTVPQEVAEFLLAADTVATAADDLLTEAAGINETWDEGRNFSLALNSLRDFATKTAGFAQGVADTSVPEGLNEVWEPVRSAAATMLSAANEMVTGLQATDTGQIRRAALRDLEVAVADLSLAVDTAVEAAE